MHRCLDPSPKNSRFAQIFRPSLKGRVGTHHLTSIGPLLSLCPDSGMMPSRRATSE
jgi:hypothetical protein